MRIQHRLFFLSSLFLCGCAGFGTTSKNIAIRDLKERPQNFSGTFISVSGYIKVDTLGNVMLFANKSFADRDDFNNELDIVQKTNINKFRDSECVLIGGKFISYGEEFLPLDFLRSNIGLIEVKTLLVRSCDGG